jgi:alpha-tubulin suppressor-like RCC1 family protein
MTAARRTLAFLALGLPSGFACGARSSLEIEIGAPDSNAGIQVGAPDASSTASSTPNCPPAPPGGMAHFAHVAALAAGESYTCALLTDSSVDCWGQFGSGSSFSSTKPVEVVSGGINEIAAGDRHACLLESGIGWVGCWGDNSQGQLGLGSIGFPSSAGLSTTGMNLVGTVAIAAGSSHTCALLGDGRVECWGANNHGQLGSGEGASSGAPVIVSNVTSATAIAAGGDHTCARLADGTVTCWGSGTSGELGNGQMFDSPRPVVVANLKGVVNDAPQALPLFSLDDPPLPTRGLTAGAQHSCALLSDGTVDCWGSNPIGDPRVPGSDVPVAVPALAGVTDVAAGSHHTCAVQGPCSTLQCWGETDLEGVSPAVRSPGLSGVRTFAAGGGHTCAVLSDFSVWCWGLNDSGQLGNGALGSSGIPVPVTW